MAATRDELMEIAERALAGVRGEQAQATAWWERQLSAGAGRAVTSEALSVEVAVLRDGRVGTATTTSPDGLERAAELAARLAATGPEALGELPDPAPGPRARRLRRERRAARAARRPARLGQLAGGGGEDGDRVDQGRARVRAAQLRRAAGPAPGRARPVAGADGDGRRARGARRRRAGRGGRGAARRRRSRGDRARRVRRRARAVGDGRGRAAGRAGLRRAAVAARGAARDARGRAGGQPVGLAALRGDAAALLRRRGRAAAAAAADPGRRRPSRGRGRHRARAGRRRRRRHAARAPRARRRRRRGRLRARRAGRARPVHPVAVAARRVGDRPPRLGAGRGRPADPRRRAGRAGRQPHRVFEPFELLGRVQALNARQRTIPSPLQRSARTASATVAPAARAGGGLFVAGPA